MKGSYKDWDLGKEKKDGERRDCLHSPRSNCSEKIWVSVKVDSIRETKGLKRILIQHWFFFMEITGSKPGNLILNLYDFELERHIILGWHYSFRM